MSRTPPAGAFFALFTALSLALPVLAADPPKCTLARIAEWPVQLQRGLPIIEGSINGKKVGVLLDTGAFASLVTKAAAERLGLVTRETAERILGFGGVSNVYVTRIDELRIGASVSRGLRVRVGGERPIPGVDFILGDDFFHEIDVEFDYAKRVVRLFQPLGCKGVALAYWDRNALQLPMEDEGRVHVPIKVNGRPARALLDSGASSSVVAMPFAAKLGITPQTPGVVPSGCSGGIGADLVHSWVAGFDTVEIAEQVTRDPRLHISNYMSELVYYREDPIDVILGTDFLRAHRVLVSRSQRKVYFSYIGGIIFPTTPAQECDERLRGKSPAEALAAYDQALAKDPRDIKALLGRAVLRARMDGDKAALQDLDAAIRLEPGNAVALAARADVRAGLKDYEGALLDSDAAIAAGMRSAQTYVARGWYRRAQGDRARAIEEYDHALRLDPRYPPALRARGLQHFHDDRYEAAERDFVALLAIRPSGVDSIWLSLARVRRGLDGNAILEQGIGRLKDGEWPAPVLRYLLGQIDLAALDAAAASPDEKTRRNQECEARYYAAARFIATGKRGAARPLLERARDECPTNYIEYEAALVELDKLQ